jgi:hypothetical protein
MSGVARHTLPMRVFDARVTFARHVVVTHNGTGFG